MRWLLKLLILQLRRYPRVYTWAWNLVTRRPWLYSLLRYRLLQEPESVGHQSMLKPLANAFPGNEEPLPKLPPLGPCSDPSLVAQRRLERALWQYYL